MKVKIIDILNKINNNEEVPEIIKFDEKIYKYNKSQKDYLNEISDWHTETLLFRVFNCHFINELLEAEVEVIEDVKEIAPLYYNRAKDGTYNLNTKAGVYSLGCIEFTMLEKINELVQAINELRKEKKQ